MRMMIQQMLFTTNKKINAKSAALNEGDHDNGADDYGYEELERIIKRKFLDFLSFESQDSS